MISFLSFSLSPLWFFRRATLLNDSTTRGTRADLFMSTEKPNRNRVFKSSRPCDASPFNPKVSMAALRGKQIIWSGGLVARQALTITRSASVDSDLGQYDICVVGGGIVGMATAREMALRHPGLKLAVVEKEKEIAFHQSGRNSGVIHAGIYYAPGSLKAKLCVEGVKLGYRYFDENNVPYNKCGKLVVATDPGEIPELNKLFIRGQQNGVQDLRLIGPEEIREMEPHCRGVMAIDSPHTGIVDYAEVTRSFAKNFEKRGGKVLTGFEVTKFGTVKESSSGSKEGLAYPVRVIGAKKRSLTCKWAVTCGGLYADRLAAISGSSALPRIVPFRGEYLVLKPEKSHLARGNIYPVPNPKFPFLGVHFTPRMDGSVWLGPNAVLAFHREGYSLSHFSLDDFTEAVTYRGFRKLVARHWQHGAKEILRSLSIPSQVEQLRKFVPELTSEDVLKGPSGVRAQALDREGNLVDDFVFDTGTGQIGTRVLHVKNAPSPAATSSLAIAKVVADTVEEKFEL